MSDLCGQKCEGSLFITAPQKNAKGDPYRTHSLKVGAEQRQQDSDRLSASFWSTHIRGNKPREMSSRVEVCAEVNRTAHLMITRLKRCVYVFVHFTWCGSGHNTNTVIWDESGFKTDGLTAPFGKVLQLASACTAVGIRYKCA